MAPKHGAMRCQLLQIAPWMKLCRVQLGGTVVLAHCSSHDCCAAGGHRGASGECAAPEAAEAECRRGRAPGAGGPRSRVGRLEMTLWQDDSLVTCRLSPRKTLHRATPAAMESVMVILEDLHRLWQLSPVRLMICHGSVHRSGSGPVAERQTPTRRFWVCLPAYLQYIHMLSCTGTARGPSQGGRRP